ncbi:hypothetical protein [Nocardia cyriacigeorgica]|uniref:hypothetical protein n=1 Tax=Nocardia cyriacigeorgica TaxID=135487 RepID=UPI0018962DFB|nr:hypothetical protein [Nocardia cyriacigeorgica]MBF6285799.1 hypothetical protein [Nocardia cyriacigeorgica]
MVEIGGRVDGRGAEDGAAMAFDDGAGLVVQDPGIGCRYARGAGLLALRCSVVVRGRAACAGV